MSCKRKKLRGSNRIGTSKHAIENSDNRKNKVIAMLHEQIEIPSNNINTLVEIVAAMQLLPMLKYKYK